MREEAGKHKAIIDKLKNVLVSLEPEVGYTSGELPGDDTEYLIKIILKLVNERKKAEEALRKSEHDWIDAFNDITEHGHDPW